MMLFTIHNGKITIGLVNVSTSKKNSVVTGGKSPLGTNFFSLKICKILLHALVII